MNGPPWGTVSPVLLFCLRVSAKHGQECTQLGDWSLLKSLTMHWINDRSSIHLMNTYEYQRCSVNKDKTVGVCVCVWALCYQMFFFPPSRSLFEVFDDGNLPPIGVFRAEAIQVETAVPGKGARNRAERECHVGGNISLLIQVDRQCPLAGGHFLVDGCVDAQLGGQLALDGRGALELVIDVDAESPPRLFEFRRHIGRPLGRVSSKLPHLQRDITDIMASGTQRVSPCEIKSCRC